MKDNKGGSTVLLTVIAIATLVVALVGATFAYFTATVQGNNEASSIVIRTASIGNIVYENGTELTLENAYPGAYSNKITFTVSSVDNDAALPYELSWVEVSNDFVLDSEGNSDLVYSLEGTASGTGTLVDLSLDSTYDNGFAAVPTVGPVKIGSGSLAAGGETHTYEMQVHFKETATDQNSNQGKTFAGKIKVTTNNSDTTYYNSENPNGTTTQPTSAY